MQDNNHVSKQDSDIEVPLLDLRPIHKPLADQLKDVINTVFDSNRFIGGPEVESFEHEAAQYCRAKHAIGVSSGTDAIIVSLMALDIKHGDEVIVPSFTFFATAGSVYRLGAKPVFCDIKPDTFNLNPDKLEALITSRTKAVIPVHLFGQCADMESIINICQRHSLKLVEDAAQALGARYHGRFAGTMGSTGCFSFFPSKNLGGIGDGGMVITNDSNLAAQIRNLRDHGAERRYYHSCVGGNFRLDAIQAAVLRIKLSSLEDWHDQRRKNAAIYKDALAHLEQKDYLRVPVEEPNQRHVFNQFVIRAKERDKLQEYLTTNRIGTAIYYPVPLHLQDCFFDLDAKKGSLPESEAACREVLALPIFPGLNESQLNKVISCIEKFYTSKS